MKIRFCTLLQGLESQRRLHYHTLKKSITDFTIIQHSCVRVAGTLNGCESSALLSLQSCDLYKPELRKKRCEATEMWEFRPRLLLHQIIDCSH